MNKTQKTQIIEKDGKPAFAVLPWDEYEDLIAAAEDAEDRAAAAAVRDDPNEEYLPGEMVNRMIDGENPVLVWREHRGLTGEVLAGVVGISQPYLSQIETGKKSGSIDVMAAIATALGVTLDDIVTRAEPEASTAPARRTARRKAASGLMKAKSKRKRSGTVKRVSKPKSKRSTTIRRKPTVRRTRRAKRV